MGTCASSSSSGTTPPSKWKVVTDAAIAGAVAGTSCADGGYPTNATHTSTQCGDWSLETAEVVDVSLQNVHCKSIVLAAQSTRTHISKDACCVVDAIATKVSEALTAGGSFTAAELLQFWKNLSTIPPPPSWTAPNVKQYLQQHFKQACGLGGGTIQSASIDSVLFSASSDVTCDKLSIVFNKSSSSISCIVSTLAQAQRDTDPSSYTPPASAHPSSSSSSSAAAAAAASFCVPREVWIGGTVGVILLLLAAVAWALWPRRNRSATTLSAEDVVLTLP